MKDARVITSGDPGQLRAVQGTHSLEKKPRDRDPSERMSSAKGEGTVERAIVP